MKKITFIATLVLMMVLLAIPSFAAAQPTTPVVFQGFNLVYNGEAQEFGVDKPLNLNGRTMLPLVYMFELINEDKSGYYEWDAAERMVTVVYKDTTVKLWIDKPDAEVNGEKVSVGGASPVIYKPTGRTYLPMNFVGTSFDQNVRWDAATKTAYVVGNNKLEEATGIMTDLMKDLSSDAKVSYTYDMVMNTDMDVAGETVSVNMIMSMDADIDPKNNFAHTTAKVEAEGISQNTEVYMDGSNIYTVVGEEVIKQAFDLNAFKNADFVSGWGLDESMGQIYGLREDATNYVVSTALTIPTAQYEQILNQATESLGTGAKYTLNSNLPAYIEYSVDKTTGKLTGMIMNYNIDMSMTISNMTIRVKADTICSMREFIPNATFDSVIPADVKSKAKSL